MEYDDLFIGKVVEYRGVRGVVTAMHDDLERVVVAWVDERDGERHQHLSWCAPSDLDPLTPLPEPDPDDADAFKRLFGPREEKP